VVPVAIHSMANIDSLLIKGTWKNPLKVIIGEPFSVEGKTYDDRYDVAKQTREAVMDLISSGSTSSATNGDSPNQEKAEA
ncbi:MAG: hypothetical protein NZ707_04130, partial [Rhodospirillales bacterium]|nr:hypothetical protein [Rhodospirillales bacterium]